MKKVLYGVTLVGMMVWLVSFLTHAPLQWTVWQVRKELILLTGIVAFLMMALLMLLAVRPKWLETTFGGLDKMYYLHKWAGIWAISIGATHYLLKLSGKVLVMFIDRPVRGGGMRVENFFSQNRHLAENLAEWALWFLLVSLVLTLWPKFSYHIWRYTHKLMPVVFLILVFHVIVLSPAYYWLQPVGGLVALGCVIGSVCAVLSLFGLIGRQQRYQGQVTAIKQLTHDITELVCQVKGQWHHKAGQFIFLTHSKLEGAHPFTIACFDNKSQQLRLYIKALGDYTKNLQQAIKAKDHVTIEGAYGCFDFTKRGATKQIWIAGGIGITPFIAWLESLQQDPAKDQYRVDLYYCVNNPQAAVFAERLESLVKTLPAVKLYLYYSEEQGYLTVNQLHLVKDEQGQYPSIWFCGPASFAESLKYNLSKRAYPLRLFHQEYFAMR